MTIRLFSELSGINPKRPTNQIQLEPELEGPARPTVQDILSKLETDPNPEMLLKRNKSKEIKIEVAGLSDPNTMDFYKELANSLGIPLKFGMSDVLNACILDAMSLILNINPFGKRKRNRLIFSDRPPIKIVADRGFTSYDETESSRVAVSLSRASIVCKEKLGSYILDLRLLPEPMTFVYSYRQAPFNSQMLEKEIKYFYEQTLVPKYFDFVDHSLQQPFLDKCRIKSKLSAFYTKIINYMVVGLSSIRSLSQLVLFPFREKFKEESEAWDSAEKIGIFVIEKLQQAKMMPLAMEKAFLRDKKRFWSDISIIYKVYFSSKTLFELFDTLRLSINQIQTSAIKINSMWKIPGIQDKGDFRINYSAIVMIATVKACIHKFNSEATFLNARVNPKTTLLGFLKLFPSLEISKIDQNKLNRYLKGIIDFLNYKAWGNNKIQPQDAGNGLGIEFVKDKSGKTQIRKTTILNEKACVLDSLKSNLNLLDQYFIPSMLIGNPNLTNMDVFRKIYLDVQEIYNPVEQSSRWYLPLTQITEVDVSGNKYTDDNWANTTIGVLDIIYLAVFYSVRNYALKNCGILKKNEKVESLTFSKTFDKKVKILISELKTESSVEIVGKVVLASALVYAATRMFKSKRVKPKK